MIHFYSLSETAVMEMPIRRFWFLTSCIDRIMAQKDLRAMSVVSVAQAGGQPAKEHRMRLVVELGDIQKLDAREQLFEKRDDKGFSELKRLAAL